ncbi:MAG: DUF4438 domain-containing protein [Thermotoga sp.]|nr:MAG: DUF4438 domain-containing protein [Thermotoga sp.]
MRINEDEVVMISVAGKISHPTMRTHYRVDGRGTPHIFPGVGGIVYNFTLGDPAFKPVGDHVEPDVSIGNENREKGLALMTYSCVGNEAVVVSGDAKGRKGYVIGKHGGIDHVIVHFDELDGLKIGDEILIKACGQGLKLLDHPDVKVYNVDPNLLKKIPIEEKGGKIFFPVTVRIPAELMGSGVGANNPAGGDYDIITNDSKMIEKLGIDKVRIGDFVAIENHDNSYGLGGYRKGAISIGVVVHSNCVLTGHGPGVVVIMTSPDGKIEPILDEKANLKNYIGRS